jgi:hypothetical protein
MHYTHPLIGNLEIHRLICLRVSIGFHHRRFSGDESFIPLPEQEMALDTRELLSVVVDGRSSRTGERDDSSRL